MFVNHTQVQAELSNLKVPFAVTSHMELLEAYNQFFPGKKCVSNKAVWLLMRMSVIVFMIKQLSPSAV